MTFLTPFWRKNILWIVLLIFSYLAIIFLVLLPSAKQIERDKQTISTRQNELETLNYKIQVLQKRSRGDDILSKIISDTNLLLPANTETSSFIVQLENLANLNNTIISNLAITEPKSTSKLSVTNKIQSIIFSFDLNGSYETVTNVIKGLETLGRFNTTTSINMISHDDGKISTQIKGNIYYGKQ